MTDTDNDNTPDSPGLYLMGARWYLPEMGRFLEPDPLGEEGGLNLYSSTGSSPVLWVDPTGLRPAGLTPTPDQLMAQALAKVNEHQEFQDQVAEWDAVDEANEEPNQEKKTEEKPPSGSGNPSPGTTDEDQDGTPDSNSGTATAGTTTAGKDSTSSPSSQKGDKKRPTGVDSGSSTSRTGILERDSNGNPVFAPRGDPVAPDPRRAGPALLQPGDLTTSNGFRIRAYQNLSDNKAWDTDCHGYSIADGKFWINDPDMEGFLAAQTYLARHPVVTQTDFPAMGDIVVYRSEGKVVHSAVLTAPGMVTMASGTWMWGDSKTTTVPVSSGWPYSPTTIEYWTAGGP